VAIRVLIVGVSARGLAESAARAGYEVAAVDGFGDLDLRASAPVVKVARAAGRFSARAAVAAARELPCDAVVYQASLDNHPDAVRALARGRRELWGNRPAVLARVRDPRLLARVVAAAGLPGPLVRLTRPRHAARGALGTTWLLKPLRSGGGEAIRPWRRTEPVPRGSYLQQRIGGVAGSIVFVADGRRAVPLGVSRILAGERAFGADGFRYCGNILGAAGDGQFPSDGALVARATRLARAVTAAFGLVGVNGIDFVAQRGLPYAIEVNPRYTAAMELVERAYGLSIFDIHVRACAGALPVFDFAAARRRAQGAVGKAIVYARRPFELGDATAWLEDEDVRDISPPGTRFAPRDPISTVFAHGADAARCHAALVRRAAALYRQLEDREASIA
jgi:predicted ATP-grasp superfamily ATP-dependent carboligase